MENPPVIANAEGFRTTRQSLPLPRMAIVGWSPPPSGDEPETPFIQSNASSDADLRSDP